MAKEFRDFLNCLSEAEWRLMNTTNLFAKVLDPLDNLDDLYGDFILSLSNKTADLLTKKLWTAQDSKEDQESLQILQHLKNILAIRIKSENNQRLNEQLALVNLIMEMQNKATM